MGSQSESNKESIKEDLRTYLPGSFIIDLSGTSKILSDAASLYNATNLTRLIALTANTDSYWDMPFSPSDFPSVADIVGMLGMQFDSLTTDVQDALTNLDPTSPAFTDFLTNKFPGQTVEVMQELTGASDAEMATYSFLVLERAKVQAAEMLGIDPSILDYGSHPGGYLGWLQDSFSDPDTQDALNKINTEANAIVNGEITPVRQEYIDQQNEIEAQAQAEADRLAEEEAEAERIRLAEEEAEAERIRLAEEEAEAQRLAEAEAERIAAEEATKNVFASVGYNPNEQEILDNVGKTEQEIKDYVDPRYVTEAEAADAFEAANGYEPNAEEIQEFIGQRSQTQTEQEIKDYVDPRQITVEEVKEWAATNGYEITDEEAKEYATQGTIEDITTESDAIYKEFDENAVTQAELEIIAAEQNFDLANLDEDSLAELVGNNKESDVVKNIDSRATTIDELADIYKNRTGEDLTPEAAEAMLEQANTAIEGELTEEAFEGWVKENVELDILYQVGRMATGVRNVLFGTGPGGRPKTLTEIMEDILDRQAAGPAGMGYPIKVTFDPTQGTWAELKIPVPLPVNGPPIKIPLFDENGTYIGPSTPSGLLVDPETGIITQVVDGVKQTVGQVTGNVVQIFDAAGEVIRSVPLGMLEEGSWEEGDPNPFDLEDSNGDGTIDPQTDQNGIPIDPETGLPVYEMPEIKDEDDRLALLSDVEAAKEEVLSTLGDQLATLGFDIEEVKDILSGVEESLVGVATLEDLKTLREGIKEDLAVELDSLGVDVNDINETLDDLDSTINSIATQVGLPSREDDPDTEEDESRPATGLFARIEELQKEGVNQTEAINTAIAELAESQNTTKDDILEQLDTTEANLAAGIADLSTELNDRVDELVAAGEDRATAVDTVLDNLSTEIGTTKDDILEQLGTTEANLAAGIEAVAEDVAGVAEDVADVAGQVEDLDTELNTRIDALVEQGATEYEALSGAISSLASDLNTSEENILSAIATSDSDIKALIGTPAIEDDPTTEEDESAPATGLYAEFGPLATKTDVEAVGTSVAELSELVTFYANQGFENDEALSLAISDLSDRLGTTEENLLTSLGETEETILDAVEGVSAQIDETNVNIANLNELIVQYELDGKTRDEALSLALSDLSTDLGITKEEILTNLGETEETILTRIAESEDNTEEYLTYISNIIGIPASEITQEDVDGIVGLLGEEEAITEINNDIRLYDANFDGVINDIDIGLLQGFVDAGVEGVGEIPATGLYADAARRQLEIQGYIDDSDKITRGLIEQEGKDTRQLIGQTALVNALASAGDLSGTRVDVSTPDPARINYIYDFADIFATPQQKGLFPSPYGGPQRAQQQQIAQRRGIMSGPMQIGGTSRGPLQIGGMAQGGKVDYDFTDEIMQIMSYGDN